MNLNKKQPNFNHINYRPATEESNSARYTPLKHYFIIEVEKTLNTNIETEDQYDVFYKEKKSKSHLQILLIFGLKWEFFLKIKVSGPTDTLREASKVKEELYKR